MFRWIGRMMRALAARPGTLPPIDPSLFGQDGADLFAALRAHWQAVSPANYGHDRAEAEVAALEARYSLRLPEDFRAYLCGAAPDTSFMDDHGFQWWSPRDIRTLAEELPDDVEGETLRERDAWLVFADYLIWCYAWAICCSSGPNRGKIALIGDDPETIVAEDLRTFLALALTDADAIHPRPSAGPK